MKGPVQPDRALRGLQVVLAVIDAVGRLALPAAVLWLARGASDGAMVAALVAAASGLLRGTVAARAARRALGAAWSQVIVAARARPVEALPRRREDGEGVAVLMEGVQEQAMFSAVFVPHLAGVIASAVGIAVGSVLILGALPSLAGAVLLAALGALTLGLGRGLRKAQLESWTSFGLLASELRVLLDGAIELRAAGRETHVAARVSGFAFDLARHEARATAVSTRMGILPASLALLAVATPLQVGVERIEAVLAGNQLFQASIIGAAAVATALAAGRVWEQWTSTEPRRARFRAFVAAYPAGTELARRGAAPTASLADVPIGFVGFGRDWNGDGILTPARLDLDLPARTGIALVGPNGSGKTTAALALLGVVPPTVGHVDVDGCPAHQLDRAAIGDRIAYVPQDPLLVSGESLAWHCRLHASEPPTDPEIDASLERVGLIAALASRARARGLAVRELPAGELSGGERRRLALARALARPRELYVLDEPEAGLDATARADLVATIAGLTRDARVLLIAHDPDAIPRSFRVVQMSGAARPPAPPQPGP